MDLRARVFECGGGRERARPPFHLLWSPHQDQQLSLPQTQPELAGVDRGKTSFFAVTAGIALAAVGVAGSAGRAECVGCAAWAAANRTVWRADFKGRSYQKQTRVGQRLNQIGVGQIRWRLTRTFFCMLCTHTYMRVWILMERQR